MAQPEQIQSYLEENTADNVILLGPSPDLEVDAATALKNSGCESRSRMKKWMDNPNNITLACATLDKIQEGVDRDLLFVRVNIGDISVYVPVVDMQALIEDTNHNIFQVSATSLTLPITASLDVAVGGSFSSAAHCQQGTDKKIYRLHPVEFENGNFVPVSPTPIAEGQESSVTPAVSGNRRRTSRLRSKSRSRKQSKARRRSRKR